MKTTNTAILKAYVDGVLQRADHHARAVEDVVLPLCGAIVWAQDDDRPLEILVREGESKNVLWAVIRGKRWALSYNHAARVIEMRENTTHGNVMYRFDNSMSATQVREIFKNLMEPSLAEAA